MTELRRISCDVEYINKQIDGISKIAQGSFGCFIKKK